MQQQHQRGAVAAFFSRMREKLGDRSLPVARVCLIALFVLILLVAIAVGSLFAHTGGDVAIERGMQRQDADMGAGFNAGSGDSGGTDAGGSDASAAKGSDASTKRDESTSGQGAGGDAGSASKDAAATESIFIDIDGAVVHPGVYELAAGSRVSDAIEAAGGLADDADTAQVNRAAALADGLKIRVPRIGEVLDVSSGQSGVASSSGGSGSSSGLTGSASSAGSLSATQCEASSGLININTADASALDGLPGIGPSTAEAIIRDREQQGPFSSPEDLMRVSGIGEKKFEKIKGLICV